MRLHLHWHRLSVEKWPVPGLRPCQTHTLVKVCRCGDRIVVGTLP